ncbi:ribonuclease domain-containing protein [Dechloromonas sp.]|uniref:ribonuclease domain-containing protein n=1 Tax=Dechloromonas sp. TaxID=1917218 RepID=UPI00263F8F8A|nr:ribonuclease domain-containing protein [Dechloromonas sp.]
MKTWLRMLLALWLTFVSLAGGTAHAFERGSAPAVGTVLLQDLPREAHQTLTLIKAGGPFPYARDGIVFGNFEKLLPKRPRGHYREYTVKTPWRKDRGPRRIVAGAEGEYYYTDDHYESFRRIRETP